MKRLSRKITGIMLTLALLLTLLPVTALADTGSTDDWCSRSLNGKHSWTKWEVIKKPTCTATGVRERNCTACRYIQTEKIKKIKHDYTKWRTIKEATCTRKGEQSRRCKVCEHLDTRETDKLPHTWGEWTVTKEATCTATGLREHTCKICGQTKEEQIEKLPHDWSAWEDLVAPTDHTRGTRAHTCKVCGAQETEDYDPEGTIRRGAKGAEVKQLQEVLICYGALKKGGADGSFGKGTERAIKAVQEAEGLEADGVAWPQTLALLGHRFGEWRTVSELTRTTDGVRERVCERCGFVERDVAEARPVIKRGQKGKPVEFIQWIIQEIGYHPGGIDGVFGPRLDAAIVEWARDNDWYYEPGLLKPIDIDRIVAAWVESDSGIGICGATTPVNLKITVTPDFNMFLVYPGQSLKFNYTVVNAGTEDCTLGPLFLSYSEKTSYVSAEKYYHFVGDLSGLVLKARGANSYSSSFTVTADKDRMVLDDPQLMHYAMYVNAWVLGVSKADGGKWYSNIDQKHVNMYDPVYEVDPKFVMTGRVLEEKPWYVLGDKVAYEVALQNDTGEDITSASVEAVGYFSDGTAEFMSDKTGPIPAGGTWSKTYTHVIDTNDEFFDGKFPFWLEAVGVTAGGRDVAAPQVSLSVDVRDIWEIADGRLKLSRSSEEAEDISRPAGEPWHYKYRVENTGDVELHDVEIRAYLDTGFGWHPLDEKAVGTLAAGSADDMAGEHVAGTLYTVTEDAEPGPDGARRYAHCYYVQVVATGVTPDGEIVHAEPFFDRVVIDFEDDDRFTPHGLKFEARIVDQKSHYADGESFECEVSLTNLIGEPLPNYSVLPRLFTSDWKNDHLVDPIKGGETLAPGQTWTKRFELTADRFAETDDYQLKLAPSGWTADEKFADADPVSIPITIMPLKEQDRHSLPVGGADRQLRTRLALRNLGDRGLAARSLTVIEQTTNEHAYYNGASVPVQMRLTIDDDQYDFLGIQPAPGDSVSDEPWMHDTLMPGESYDFTYTMEIDPDATGWANRNVAARLSSYSTGMDEYESCEVHPLHRPAMVSITEEKPSAALDLTVDRDAYYGYGHPGDMLDIPFTAGSSGNTAVKNVKLVYEETADGASLTSGELPVTHRLDPGAGLELMRQIMVVGASGSYAPPIYKLKLHLTGTFLNSKGKQEDIESDTVELPLEIPGLIEGRSQLALTGWTEPKKNAYAPGDKLTLHLRAENLTGVDLNNVVIDPAWPCDADWADLKGKHTIPHLDAGASDEIGIDYTVRVDDLDKGKIRVTFAAEGTRFDDGTFERSPGWEFALPIEDDLQQTLNLYALPKLHAETYARGAKVPVELSYRNGPLSSARFYAVGDNRAAASDGSWHGFGHGLKGYQCLEETDVPPTKSWHRVETFVRIPADFEGDTFCAAWVIEADEAETGKAVRSNVATLELPVGEASDEDLTFLAKPDSSSPVTAIGEKQLVHLVLQYKGNNPPEAYTYRYRLKGAEEWRSNDAPAKSSTLNVLNYYVTMNEEDMTDGGWTFEFEGYSKERPDLTTQPVEIRFSMAEPPAATAIEDVMAGADELMPGDEPVPDGIDDDGPGPDEMPGDEPVPDGIDDGPGPGEMPGDEPKPDGVDDEPEEGAPLEDVSLDVDLLTPCPNPATGEWPDGYEIKAKVFATYNVGPKVPVRIEVCVTDAVETAEPQEVLSVSNASVLSDTSTIVLDAGHAVNDQCVYDYVAYVYLDDEDHVDCYSETVPLIFDMAAGG